MTITDKVPTVRNFQDAFRAVRRAKEEAAAAYQEEYNRVSSEQRDARRAAERKNRQDYETLTQEYRKVQREAEERYYAQQREADRAYQDALKPLDDARIEALRGAAETRDAAIAQATADFNGQVSEEAKPLAWLVEHYYEGYSGDVTNALRYCREHAHELDNGKTVLDLLDDAHSYYGWCGVWSGQDGARARMIKEGVVTETDGARKELLRRLINAGFRRTDAKEMVERFDREVTARVVLTAPQVPDTAEKAETPAEVTVEPVTINPFTVNAA